MSQDYHQLRGDSILKTTKRHIDRRLLKAGTIYDFQFSCTWKCSAKCNHCFIWKKPDSFEFSIAQLEALLQPRSLFKDVQNIILTGGDPFEREDIKDIIYFFSQLCPNASISTPTNGYHYDRVIETARFCQEMAITQVTSLSLDGFKNKHDGSRGIPLYEKINIILTNLIMDQLPVDVNITVYPFNLDEFESLFNYLTKKGIYVRVSLPATNWYFNNQNCDFSKVFKDPRVNDFFNERKHMPFYDLTYTPKCFHGFHSFYMTPNGFIHPCQGRDFVMGVLGIRYQTFGEIWHSERATQVRKKILNCVGCSTTVERCMNIRYDGRKIKLARLLRKLRC